MKHTGEMKNERTKEQKYKRRKSGRTIERDNETTKVYLLSGTLCQICNISIPWQNV